MDSRRVGGESRVRVREGVRVRVRARAGYVALSEYGQTVRCALQIGCMNERWRWADERPQPHNGSAQGTHRPTACLTDCLPPVRAAERLQRSVGLWAHPTAATIVGKIHPRAPASQGPCSGPRIGRRLRGILPAAKNLNHYVCKQVRSPACCPHEPNGPNTWTVGEAPNHPSVEEPPPGD